MEKRANEEEQIEPIEVIVDPLPVSSNKQEAIIIIEPSKAIDTVKAPIDAIITLPNENKPQMKSTKVVYLKKKCKDKCILNPYTWLIIFFIESIVIFILGIAYLIKRKN